MPVVENSTFRAAAWLPGGHAQTIYPALFRRVRPVTTRRERLELPDGDFLDLDWSDQTSGRLAILSHGLEGSSLAAYIQGMARELRGAGWDVLAWNFRGCGGEPNRLKRFYHSGATEDLAAVIAHAQSVHPTSEIALIGFSLGGNLTLKYLGEEPSAAVTGAVVFSTPCDLADSSARLASWENAIYMRRFMKDMQAKIRGKHRLFPEELDLTGLRGMRTFGQFDDRYTAPLHGFRDAEDYWKRNSARPFIPKIRVPTLLVNALNDPLLGPACHPFEEAAANDHFYFEAPDEGGHVGFLATGGVYWSEKRAVAFLHDCGNRSGNERLPSSTPSGKVRAS